MTSHIHYDLASAEKSIRAGFEQMNTAAMPPEMTDADREYVRIQIDLQEVQIQFALWHLRCINEGASVDTLIKAAGHAIGTMLWSFADNTEFEPVDVLNEALATAAETVVTFIHGGSADARISKTTVNGDAGGHA